MAITVAIWGPLDRSVSFSADFIASPLRHVPYRLDKDCGRRAFIEATGKPKELSSGASEHQPTSPGSGQAGYGYSPAVLGFLAFLAILSPCLW